MRRILAVVALTSCSVGCSNFPRADRVEDTRVLAVRADPAEILYSPLHLFRADQRPPVPLPVIDVDVEVFAYDPRGGVVEAEMLWCPEGTSVDGVSDSTCRRSDPEVFVEREPLANPDELRAFYTPRTLTRVIPDDARDGRVPNLADAYAFTPSVIDSIIEDEDDRVTPIPSIFPLLPRFVVEVANGDQGGVHVERAYHRFPVNLDLTSEDLPVDLRGDLARNLGFRLCDEAIPVGDAFEEGEADCLFARTANRNPDLTGFDIVEDGEVKEDEMTVSDTAFVMPSSIITANAGARLTIEPVFREGADEHYQVVSFDIERSRVVLLNRIEDLVVTWVSTDGDVSGNQTALQLNHRLGIDWQLPAGKEAGEEDVLIAIVQDQRGGTTVGTIVLRYR